MTPLHDFGSVLGWSFWTLLLGSHNLVVMVLGSCVSEVALRNVRNVRSWLGMVSNDCLTNFMH